MIIGIDNGIEGGLVAISECGPIIAAIPMPVQRPRKRNQVDVVAICEWMCATRNGGRDRIKVILEEPGGSKSAKAAVSMAGSFHAIRGMLEAFRTPWEPVTPQQWQKVMLPGCEQGETKPRALEAARRLWPDQDWRASDRCRIAHDGMIDAALIAEWARRTNV